MKILVVDDEQSYRMLLEDFLKREGWTTFSASHGEEGLKVLSTTSVNIVISDVYMPIMDGLKFLKAARLVPGHENTPFLFVSANDDELTKAALQAAKNGGFMKKSKPMHELKAWIAYLLMPMDKRPALQPGSTPESFTRTKPREDRAPRR